MTLLQIFSVVIVLSAGFAYLNEKFIHWPATISLMLLGLALSIGLQIMGFVFPAWLERAEETLQTLDFSGILMDFMLGFLLFAGALHTNWARLKKARGPILTFATVGVIISTVLIGFSLYVLLQWFDFSIPLMDCMLFGALISPTDPIAVLGILKKAGAPESMEIKIVGESLFNDGTGVVVFITLFRMASLGVHAVSAQQVIMIIAQEVVGGIGLGLISGYVTYHLLKSIDHYQTEVLLTVALVMGGYLVADLLHLSGPLAMVTAGLIIGNKGRTHAMSDVTLDYTFKFWEIVDEIMNAILFVLIGLELLLVPFSTSLVIVGAITIAIVLGVRWISLAIPSFAFGFQKEFESRTLTVMTWGGLRGGISIALALSLPTDMHKETILVITYIVVLFSILVQGLTIGRVIKRVVNVSDSL